MDPIVSIEDVEQVFINLFGDSIRDAIPARLGKPSTGEVEVSLENADHPGLVYIHGIGGAGSTIDNPSDADVTSTSHALLLPNIIPPGLIIYNTPVLVKKKGELYYVEGLDGIKAIEFFFQLKERLQRSVDLSQFDYGMTRPATPPSLRVLVSRARYDFDGTIYDIPALLSDELSSHVPSVGLARAVRIDVKVSDKTLVITAGGSTFDDDLSHEQAFDTYYPKTIPTGQFVSSWVKLYGGITQILPPDLYAGQEVYTKTTPGSDRSVLLGSIISAGGEVVVSNGEVVWT